MYKNACSIPSFRYCGWERKEMVGGKGVCIRNQAATISSLLILLALLKQDIHLAVEGPGYCVCDLKRESGHSDNANRRP